MMILKKLGFMSGVPPGNRSLSKLNRACAEMLKPSAKLVYGADENEKITCLISILNFHVNLTDIRDGSGLLNCSDFTFIRKRLLI